MNIVWKKRAAPLPSIRKLAAGIEAACGMFFCLFLFVFLLVQMEIFRYHTSALYLEDALAASDLAAAVIDLEEYGRTGRIVMNNPEECYKRFEQALKCNLALNEHWECENQQLIAGDVVVERFIIYNPAVNGGYSNERDTRGNWVYRPAPMEGMYAPNGQPVERTGIYSEVSYEVQGVFGVRIRARKGVLVDVISCEKEGEIE